MGVAVEAASYVAAVGVGIGGCGCGSRGGRDGVEAAVPTVAAAVLTRRLQKSTVTPVPTPDGNENVAFGLLRRGEPSKHHPISR